MNIAIDVSLLSQPGSGTQSYVKYLVEHLAQVDKTNQYHLYSLFLMNYRRKVGSIKVPKQANFGFRPFCCPSRFSHFLLRMSFTGAKFFQECQVVHMPAYTILPPIKAKIVVTIHGLAPLICPQCYPFEVRKGYNYFLSWVKERADRVISVSEETRRDLIRLFHMPSEKIRVIKEAVSEQFRPLKAGASIDSALKNKGIEKPFILSVSVLSPIKNQVNIIYAYRKYLAANPKSPYRLVIVGQRGWLYQGIFKTVANLQLQEKVIFVGHISHDALVHIYNAADLFIYPSLYEGFGLPILEAMACGTPVIASNVSSPPEVAGDAARLVDPHNVEEIALAMEEVLEDEELRKRMSQKGLERAKCFSWEKTARETLRVYKEACEEG